jgi:hypothetical protein
MAVRWAVIFVMQSMSHRLLDIKMLRTTKAAFYWRFFLVRDCAETAVCVAGAGLSLLGREFGRPVDYGPE